MKSLEVKNMRSSISRYIVGGALIICVVVSTACGSDQRAKNESENKSDAIASRGSPTKSRQSPAVNLRTTCTVNAREAIDYPMSRYQRYPNSIQCLLQEDAMASDECEGLPPSDPARYRACNRQYLVSVELERKGWCWGGGDVESNKRWLRCTDDPQYRPESYRQRIPFPESEIRNLTSM